MEAQKALQALYTFYDEFTTNLPVSCGPGCATCCSLNVSVTSLEVRFLRQHPALAKHSLQEAITAALGRPYFSPSFTTNELAEACLSRKQPPEETGLHASGQCPFLGKDSLCQVYANRPFSCRAMLSTCRCTQDGEAVMAPFIYTVNLAMYQMIEHLDQKGTSGNMLDFWAEKPRTLPNRSIPGFLVAPEEKNRFRGIKTALRKFPVNSGSLEDFFTADIFR